MYSVEPSGYSNMEDAMKVFPTLLSLVLAGAAFAAMLRAPTRPAAADKKAPAAKKETNGRALVRIYKDLSQMDIRGYKAGESEHLSKVAYDSSTEDEPWKARETGRVKEGSFCDCAVATWMIRACCTPRRIDCGLATITFEM